VWFIENHFARAITLEDVAAVAGVSPYYLTRAFCDATGLSLMRYVRGRRLSEAERSLAGGAKDIRESSVTVRKAGLKGAHGETSTLAIGRHCSVGRPELG
jgi:AraC-like DNA-binding protein